MKRHGIEEFEPFECPCPFCKETLLVTEVSDLNLTDYSRSFADNFYDVMVYVFCPNCNSVVICPDDQQHLYLKRMIVRRNASDRRGDSQ